MTREDRISQSSKPTEKIAALAAPKFLTAPEKKKLPLEMPPIQEMSLSSWFFSNCLVPETIVSRRYNYFITRPLGMPFSAVYLEFVRNLK
jgi:hypothetical protein